MATQTEYRERLVAGRPGMIADLSQAKLVSRNVEGAAIGFGVPVVQGAADRGVRATTGGDTAILGITAEDQGAAEDQFGVGHSALVALEAVMWVTAAIAVSAGDAVHVVVADGTFSNTGGVVIAGARYEESAEAGAIVPIRFG